VRSRTQVRLLEMNRETFETMLHRWPGIAHDMARLLSQRLRDSENTTVSDLREKNRQLAEAFAELHRALEGMVHKEKLAQESENRFRLLAEFAPFGIILMNRDLGIDYVNPRFTETFGYRLQDIPNIHVWHQLAFPDAEYREKIVSPWEGELFNDPEAGKVRDRTVMACCRDGSRKIAHIRSVIIGNGKYLMSYEDITDRKIAEDALRDSEKQLRHMSSQLLSAQEKERKRIASELHDSVGQQLTAIKFGLENSLQLVRKKREDAVVERLETLLPIVRDTLREVRRISKDLRPSLLDDLGILATIDWFCREFQAVYTGIEVQKEIGIHEEEIVVPLKIIIFRIVQEAFNNVAKHSGAQTVRLSLRSVGREILLKIQDDGRGIDGGKEAGGKHPRAGLGLASMKERTELSGGAFSVDSAFGGGTCICATWPIRN
ncbi:MAG: PAS domain S-box protein, partial [Syntrophobacteraceae bacterium]|nr:PAS domain S-box protein [Syntrophobacteraceae bacterium]